MGGPFDQRRLAAIMFTDMVGYSALTHRNEALALSTLAEHNRLLRPLFAPFGGTEIKTIGDAFLVEFASAVDAVRCAIEIQRVLHLRNQAGDEPIRVRIGLHLGDVVMQDGDMFGDGVNIAARLQTAAQPDGICVSDDVARQVRNKIDHPLRALGALPLKNISSPIELFAVELPWLPAEAAPTPPIIPERLKAIRRLRVRLGAAAVVLTVAGIFAAENFHVFSTGAAERSIAVLPFTNLSSGAENEYLGIAMTDDLLIQLGQLDDLQVISRTSVMQYRGTQKNVRTIAAELGVATILEGSVRRDGDRLRITAQLIDARSDKHLWSKSYDGDARDIAQLQGDVTAQIAQALKSKLPASARARTEQRQKENSLARELVAKGMVFIRDAYGKQADLERARPFFEQALTVDSNTASAYAGMAIYHAMMASSGFISTEIGYAQAEAAAQKALALDPNQADAYVQLALVRGRSQRNWAEAGRLAQHAIDLDHGNADAYVVLRSAYLEPTGQLDRAIEVQRRAVELDPLNRISRQRLGLLYFMARDYDRAIATYSSIAQIDARSTSQYAQIAACYEAQGRFPDSIAAYRRAKVSWMSDADIDALDRAFAAEGSHGYFEQRFQIQQRLYRDGKAEPVNVAIAAAEANRIEQAFQFLSPLVHMFDSQVNILKLDPRLDILRSDPRFAEILRQVNLN